MLCEFIYLDAQIDSVDKKIFKVLVRSWQNKAHMVKVGHVEPHPSTLTPSEKGTRFGGDSNANIAGISSSSLNGSSTGASQGTAGDRLSTKVTKANLKSPTYLKPGGKSNMFELRISMDTEQACTLAVAHIETKRKELHAAKVARLRSILDKWASNSDFINS